jgi:drug/metabolite transporter (DMT)-like permease
MKLKKTSANLMLVAVTVLWGSGFIVTKMALDQNATTGLINIARGLIFALLIFIIFFKRITKMTGKEFFKGFFAGALNSFAFILQTVAMQYTTPSNAAFFTITNVLMVPFIVWVFYKIRPSLKIFGAVGVCLVGMAILTGFWGDNATVNKGDALALAGAFMFALSIAYISNSAKNVDYSIIAFWLGITQAIGGIIYFVFFENAAIISIDWMKVFPMLLYLGLFPSFVAQTGQVIAQQNTTATSAALILTLEAVFGSIFSVIFGFDRLTLSLFIGGSLIMLSLVISEIRFPQKPRDL